MARLLIKDVSDKLHQLLKTRAAANRQSLNAEVITILEAALDDRSGPPTLEKIDRMRVRGARPLTQVILDRARRDRR